MKWVLLLFGLVVVVFGMLLALGAAGSLATRGDRKLIDEAAARMQRAIQEEFELQVGVHYTFHSSMMKGLKQTEVVVEFPMLPPTADLQEIARRTTELAYQNVPWVTGVTIAGKDPTRARPFQLKMRPSLAAPTGPRAD